jgi:diguanylate cyclase (GGDEF)-like protein
MPPGDWRLMFDAVMDRAGRLVASQESPGKELHDCLDALGTLRGQLGQQTTGACEAPSLLRTHRELTDQLAAVQAELTALRLSEGRARHLARHDALTELPNRRQFCNRLDDALKPGQAVRPALAVLFVDLDDFKSINDQHGHDTGDQLLCIVARRLRASIRSADLVCRLGGDEFACLLSQTMGQTQLSRLAAKLFDTVSAPLQVGSLQLCVRPSIGIAVCPNDGDTPRTLLKRADAAMYRAKRNQLGFAFFDRHADA